MYVCFNSFLRYVLSRRSKTFVLFPLDAPAPRISASPVYKPTQNRLWSYVSPGL